jgi:hypothetical protein
MESVYRCFCFLNHVVHVKLLVDALQNMIREKNQDIDEKNQQIDEKNLMIDEMNRLIDEMNRTIDEKNRMFNEMNRSIDEMTRTIDEKNRNIYEKNRMIRTNKHRYSIWKSAHDENAFGKYQNERNRLVKMLYYSVLFNLAKGNTYEYSDDLDRIGSKIYDGVRTDLNEVMTTLRASIPGESISGVSNGVHQEYVTLWGCWFLNLLAASDGKYDATVIEANSLTYLSSVIEHYSPHKFDVTNEQRYDERAYYSRRSKKKQDELHAKLIHTYAHKTVFHIMGRGHW